VVKESAGNPPTRRLVSEAGADRALLAISLTLAAAAAAFFVLSYDAKHAWAVPPYAFAGYGFLVLICEATRLRFEVRRHIYVFSVSEVALVLGLFWMSPVQMLLTRVLAICIVYGYQRTPLRKTLVNIVAVAAEIAVAAYVFHQFHTDNSQMVTSWFAAYASVALADLTSTSVVIAAITLAQGWLSSTELVRLAVGTALAGVLNTTVGLMVMIVLGANRAAVFLLVIVAGVLYAGYRGYTQFLNQHKSLGELYEFTRAIGTARQDASLADPLLTRSRQLLNAESASLWLPAAGRHPELRLLARVDSPGLVDDAIGEDDVIRRRAMTEGRTIFASPKNGDEDPELRAALRTRQAKDVICAPLRSGSAVIGCLEVANRLGEPSYFGAADVRLLETLAAHAAVAVENSRLVDRLRHDAYHDSLTGLPNRRRLLGALEAAIAVQPAPGEVVALLQFDVDSLRDVNETLGHVAGDRLLAEVGRRLQAEAPKGSLIARIGGDEFAVLLRAQGAEAAQATAVALQYALVEPFALGNFTLDVGAAVGIALYPDHAPDAGTLLQRADVATYSAKTNPRSIQLYRPAMESRSVHRLGLVSELRRAIDEGALTVHYQPKVALANRELVGVECLVRWEHPEHGLVSPDDFIPVAEHTGLVGELTSRVLRTALEQCRRWHDAGRPIGVSVNLSARSLLDPEFPDELEQMLLDCGVAPNQLTLEITESGMVGDTDRPLPTLRRLFALGVRLAVDDFGTGYSSLSYLRRLPVHEVKIDKSFVLGMATDSGDLGIVRAIVDLGRHLGMAVVAEGVESEMTLTLLEDMGCDVAQGFLFSRPLPVERMEAWMAARTELEVDDEDETTGRLRVVSGQ
jgi:diguanylate cyclase (GGDEF)-like protein